MMNMCISTKRLEGFKGMPSPCQETISEIIFGPKSQSNMQFLQ